MKAIFKGRWYHIEEDIGGEYVILARSDLPKELMVDYGNPDLIIDPTDDEIADAT